MSARCVALQHVYFFSLAHPLCALLAAGHPGAGIVPGGMVDPAALQDIGHCGGWGAGFSKVHHPAARKVAPAEKLIHYDRQPGTALPSSTQTFISLCCFACLTFHNA